jgi:hypothetical protein
MKNIAYILLSLLVFLPNTLPENAKSSNTHDYFENFLKMTNPPVEPSVDKKEVFYVEMSTLVYAPVFKDETFEENKVYRKNHDIPFFNGKTILSINYGYRSPLGAFKERLENTDIWGASMAWKNLSFLNLVPGIHFQYSDFQSIEREGMVSSEMKLMQFLAGITYKKEILQPVSIFIALRDGITRLNFSSENLDGETISYLNTMGAALGLTVNFYSDFEGGIELLYEVINSAGDQIQSVMLMMKCEKRI